MKSVNKKVLLFSSVIALTSLLMTSANALVLIYERGSINAPPMISGKTALSGYDGIGGFSSLLPGYPQYLPNPRGYTVLGFWDLHNQATGESLDNSGCGSVATTGLLGVTIRWEPGAKKLICYGDY